MRPHTLLSALFILLIGLLSHREHMKYTACTIEKLKQAASQAKMGRGLEFPSSNNSATLSSSVGRLSKPALHSLAASFFPINSDTGLIDLPEDIETIIIDVGARESQFLTKLETRKDPTIALFLIDPFPDSIIPLQQRAMNYALRKTPEKKSWLDSNFTNRVFSIQAAAGEAEGTADFNVGWGPACGSLLETTESNKFWCARSSHQQRVTVITLKDLIELIPSTINIKSLHVKIDAEGADLIALRGAGDAIQRCTTVLIECRDINNESDVPRAYKDECIVDEAKEYMCRQHGFCVAHFSSSSPNGQGNVLFRKTKNATVPVFFVSQNELKHLYRKAWDEMREIQKKGG